MGTPLSVLIVEDSASDAGLMVRLLQKEGYEVFHQRVETAAQMREALRARVWDVVLSDFKVPGFGAVPALALLQESGFDLPFIAVSGVIGEETAAELMKAGAHDYVLKDHLGRLVPAIKREIHEALERLARRQAEAALKASEARFKVMFNAAPLGIALIDSLTGQIYSVNPMFAKIAGRTMEAMAHIDWMSITHPDDVQQDLDNMALLNAGKISGFQMEKRYLRPDGTPVWINMSIAPVYVEDKAHPRHLCMIEDITQRKQQERSLQENEKRFRGLIEQSLTGVYMSQDGVFLYANPRLEQLLGYRPGELVGVRTENIIIADDLPILRAERKKLRAGATSISYEVHMRRRDGTVILLGVQGHIYEINGQPATVGMAQDITEKKRAENEIKHYVAQLETAFMSTVEVATALSEMRDPYTAGHAQRVGKIAAAIGAELGLDPRRLEGLRVAGYLHDVGKITIPAEILVKPGKLTAIEFALIKGHAQSGYEVLKNVQFPWPVAEVARQHHERMDGSGYPQGLKGEAILLEARIMAVADVVEAMASHRPYRAAIGIEATLSEIELGRGTRYDPAVADACLKLFRVKGYALPA